MFEAAERELRRLGEWSGELPHRTRTGARLIVESRWTLVHDDRGQPDAVLELNTDVTERRILEQQHLRAQRMESLGTLAGGIAHDLNNMLSPILLASELLQADEDDGWRREILRTVYSSARRGADLVTQVLSFAKGIDGRRQAIAVRDLIGDLERIVSETFPKQIVLRTDVPDGLPQVMGDVTQLGQVLLNLALNARDAMGQGGVLRVGATTAGLDAHDVALNPLASVGEHVVVEVEDDGVGMPAEVTERIFEPFFTTKPHGSGTGLGLSTASAIVRSHDGFIQVYSEPGHGTTFRVYLPVAHTQAPPAPAPVESSDDLRRGDGTGVLVVDDEAVVRDVTRQTLEAYGYRVLEASDGAQAVSVFARNRDDIDIVLTDMMMPIMDGPATIHALRRLDADVRIVGASGLHGDGKVALAAAAGVRHFLPKPYTASRLLGILQTVLRDEPGAPTR